ncbi:serine hydrolase domain-containing protein [Streptomyces chartreusis]|uniref:serine hydrolase domain-containing protein n=1 Tax=Streptomyces chartreusis TaxID=1969 RepID=UPI003635C20C
MTVERASMFGGVVAPGFEAVGEAFATGSLGTGGGAFCAYVDGVKVVDIWRGSARRGVPWAEDTITTLMSTTKALAALCAQVLYSRGLLDVDAPVAQYWPEFAQAGKDKALVRHVLSHSVGLPGLPRAGTLLDWEGRGWDAYDEIAARLASLEPRWEPGTRCGYHAITYGWLVGELVRRVTGRSIGTFLREEIAEPLRADVWIGASAAELKRSADLGAESVETTFGPLAELNEIMMGAARKEGTAFAEASVYMHGKALAEVALDFLGTPRGRTPEIAGANGLGSARGLARVFAMLSMGGQLDGVRILSPESVARFSDLSISGPSAVWLDEESQAQAATVAEKNGVSAPEPLFEHWALGYQKNVVDRPYLYKFGPRGEAFGHSGLGGQLGFADPVSRVGVGFLRNCAGGSWEFSDRVVAALYECLP